MRKNWFNLSRWRTWILLLWPWDDSLLLPVPSEKTALGSSSTVNLPNATAKSLLLSLSLSCVTELIKEGQVISILATNEKTCTCHKRPSLTSLSAPLVVGCEVSLTSGVCTKASFCWAVAPMSQGTDGIESLDAISFFNFVRHCLHIAEISQKKFNK